MRAPLACLALLTLVLAGCTTVPPGPGAATPLANVRVTNLNGPASEVTLSVNPTDPLNLVGGAKDYTLGADPGPGCPEYNVWSGVYWTKDGGATWGNALMPGYPGDGNTTLLSHYTCNSDPVVVFGADGAAYYSGLAYGGTGANGVCPGDQAAPLCGGSIWVAKSTDGGETWGQFVNVAIADGGQVGLDKQWFATDPGNADNLVMTWIQFSTVAAYFLIAASQDGGATWSPPEALAELDAPIHQFAMPQVGPDGTVYVVWHNFGAAPLGVPVPLPVPASPLGQPGTAQLMFTKSQGGFTPAFAPARGVAPMHDITSPLRGEEVRTTSIPSIAVDPASGAIYVAWADEQDGQADILFVTSTDGGDTWTAPARVNQDAGGADQFMTWVTTDEEGGVDVLFYDRAYTNNTLLDLTLARSTDGGATWGSLRVTDQSWAVPEGCYHQAGFPFIGDYIGLSAGGGVLHPFWADGRSGMCEVMTAAIPYAAIPAARGNATA